MKPQELFPGTLVNYKGTPRTVFRADLNGDIVLAITYEGGITFTPVNIKDVEPIPLTMDILEANGFKFDSGKSVSSFGCYQDYANEQYQLSFYKTFRNVSRHMDVLVDENPDYWVLNGCVGLGDLEIRVKYVHEFQAILQICHYNPDIKLPD